jgi:DNA-binding response OmpR family regulator
MNILLIEDDLLLGESIKEYLEENGINVDWIYDERKLEDIYSFEKYDVIVIDLILRYKKGEEILKDLRNKNIENPILILTAKNSIKDKEICFNLGADDYLTKPFNPKELLLRLKALSGRKHICEIFEYNGLKIDIKNRQIFRKNEEIKLSDTTWKVLYILLKNRGEVVPTERILNYVWSDKPVGDENVRAYIKTLRKLLPELNIQTYKGRGYKLD